jgi:hypothetical protein
VLDKKILSFIVFYFYFFSSPLNSHYDFRIERYYVRGSYIQAAFRGGTMGVRLVSRRGGCTRRRAENLISTHNRTFKVNGSGGDQVTGSDRLTGGDR